MSTAKQKPLAKIEVALADVLKTTRTLGEMSQEEVAERADVDRSTISDLERSIGNPSLYLFIRLATALGESAPELLTRVLARHKSGGGAIADISGRTRNRPRVRVRAARDNRE